MFYHWDGRSWLDFRNWSRNAKVVVLCTVGGGIVGIVVGLAVCSPPSFVLLWLLNLGGAIAGFLVGIGVTCWLTARATRATENDKGDQGD